MAVSYRLQPAHGPGVLHAATHMLGASRCVLFGSKQLMALNWEMEKVLELHGVHGLAGIILTNDGNAILREIDVSHPAAKVRL